MLAKTKFSVVRKTK